MRLYFKRNELLGTGEDILKRYRYLFYIICIISLGSIAVTFRGGGKKDIG